MWSHTPVQSTLAIDDDEMGGGEFSAGVLFSTAENNPYPCPPNRLERETLSDLSLMPPLTQLTLLPALLFLPSLSPTPSVDPSPLIVSHPVPLGGDSDTDIPYSSGGRGAFFLLVHVSAELEYCGD